MVRSINMFPYNSQMYGTLPFCFCFLFFLPLWLCTNKQNWHNTAAPPTKITFDGKYYCFCLCLWCVVKWKKNIFFLFDRTKSRYKFKLKGTFLFVVIFRFFFRPFNRFVDTHKHNVSSGPSRCHVLNHKRMKNRKKPVDFTFNKNKIYFWTCEAALTQTQNFYVFSRQRGREN